jgi:hypothetical protein
MIVFASLDSRNSAIEVYSRHEEFVWSLPFISTRLLVKDAPRGRSDARIVAPFREASDLGVSGRMLGREGICCCFKTFMHLEKLVTIDDL